MSIWLIEEHGGFQHFEELYKAYCSNIPSWSDREELQKWRQVNVKVKILGVWDTVGSIGVPPISFFSSKLLHQKGLPTFHNIEIHDQIEFAFHAYGLLLYVLMTG